MAREIFKPRRLPKRRSMSETAQPSKQTSLPRSPQHSAPQTLALPLLFVALPAILFYTVLFRNLRDIPLLDDYDALLVFLNQIIPLQGISAKVSYFLAAQHNEYKLFF